MDDLNRISVRVDGERVYSIEQAAVIADMHYDTVRKYVSDYDDRGPDLTPYRVEIFGRVWIREEGLTDELDVDESDIEELSEGS